MVYFLNEFKMYFYKNTNSINMKKVFSISLFSVTILLAACGNGKSGPEESSVPIEKDTLGITTNKPIVDVVDSVTADKILADSASNKATAPATTTQTLVSSDGQTIIAKYQNSDGVGIVTLTKADGKEIKLMQKEASAKGGEYTNGEINWRADGDNSELIEKGKTTKFKVK